MGKVNYDGITFDSVLEVTYYKYLRMENLYFHYHPRVPIKITKNNTYTPDFVVYYPNGVVEIIETKGYNQFSYKSDVITHNIMLGKSEEDLRQWLKENDYSLTNVKTVKYRKIKFLKAYGFVDWDFKNPNTRVNQQKAKINDLSAELKELKEFKKNALRYFGYSLKMVTGKQLTKSQREWRKMYFDKMVKLVQEETKWWTTQ